MNPHRIIVQESILCLLTSSSPQKKPRWFSLSRLTNYYWFFRLQDRNEAEVTLCPAIPGSELVSVHLPRSAQASACTLAQAAPGASRSPSPADGAHPWPPLLAAEAPARSSTKGRSQANRYCGKPATFLVRTKEIFYVSDEETSILKKYKSKLFLPKTYLQI